MNREFDALVAQLGPLVLEWLVANSTAAGEIEAVRSLDNVKALAAYRRVGGTEKTVEVPLNLLTRPIDDIVAICERAAASVVDGLAGVDAAVGGAIEAAGAANLAAKAANEAVATILALKEDTLAATAEARAGAKEARDEAALARTATEESKAATGKADEATAKANDAEALRARAETGRVDAEKARVTAENSRTAEEKKRATAETGRVDAEKERVKAESARATAEQERAAEEGRRAEAETARDNAEKKRAADTAERLEDADVATAEAREVAEHPTKIGPDHYVYVWNRATHVYDKTDIYTKGEGLDYNTMTEQEKARIKGKSAYEVAVEEGFEGTVEEWLASLEGKRGEKGSTGDRGLQGERGEKGETGEVGAQGDPGAAGRDFEVPTLAVAPGENTLTYTVVGSPAPFHIGQLARVWDAEKGEAGEYVFWQLFDLAGGKALWKLAGSGDIELPGETVIISLAANQADSAGHLIGAVVKVIHRDGEETLTWQGQPLTVQIPTMVDYRVEGRDTALFAAPEAMEFIAGVGYVRMLTLTWLAERVTITATTSDGEGDATGQTVTVTEGDAATMRYQGAVGTGVTLLFRYGANYRVSCGDLPLYSTPESQSFTAGDQSRAVSVLYQRVPHTCLVFDKSIADPANIEGAGDGAIVDILAKMRRCLVKKTAEGEVSIAWLDNADSTRYADGTTAVLTGGEGDVMVYKPAFWYKYESVDANRFAYDIAEQDLDGMYIHSPASLIGAYKSNSVSSKLYSRSGVVPSGSISQANNINYAKARGAGYNIIDFEQHSMIALLLYAKYGKRNSQAILGTGGVSYDAANGSTNSLGNADTVGATAGHASFAGIEGVHGGIYEWVGGVTIENGVWTITNPDGTIRGGNAPAWAASGWIGEIAAALGPWFDVIPTATGGSQTTRYTDYYEYSAGTRVPCRSFHGSSTAGGVSCAYANFDSSFSNTYYASRLAFRGVIVEAESVQAFKALPVL
ncbi:MAG: hypothetical protein LBU98_06675 [Alistipes sp.]|jgi:hypothetical protein|nr:hypothetical protein [Alistipes sp.]